MEAAGLAIGAVALAGLATDCIDLFKYVAVAKSMGRDYEILSIKLDIQKALLLLWAQRVALFQQDYDKRLDKKITSEAIARALGGIKLLLSEGDELQHRHGHENDRSRRICVEMETTSPETMQLLQKEAYSNESVSRPFMDRLKEQSNLPIRQKSRSLIEKTRWAIQDRGKFDVLLQNLSQIISSLNSLIPDRSNTVDTDILRVLKGITDTHDLDLVQSAALSDKSNSLRLACQRRVLKKLWFYDIDRRIDHVAEAHVETFKWALRPPAEGDPWDDLSQWLREGSGIYWICGKAGSGKSTLMKYLVHQEETKRCLSEWAEGRNLVYANFFLWNIGTNDQKSQHGLARGLLYHVLEANESVLPKALPRMWRAAMESHDDLPLPSETELKKALNTLGEDHNDTAYCFFVDGLDEFSGNYTDGIDFIKSLSAYTNIKVLVSSRPIDSCAAAFVSNPQLRLQDLTRGDIAIYIEETLGGIPFISTALNSWNDSVSKLFDDIAQKASGVFLWVILACRSLLEGLEDGDYLEELHRRLDELPPELEALFQHMLNRIAPRHRLQAAKLLRICYEYRKLIIRGDGEMPALVCSIVDEANMKVAHHPRFYPLSSEEKHSMCDMLERRLRSRCCGLLELQSGGLSCSCFCGSTEYDPHHDGRLDSSVEFIHRTAFEFLSSRDVWGHGCLQISDEDFNPAEILAFMDASSIYHMSVERNLQDLAEDVQMSLLSFAKLSWAPGSFESQVLYFQYLVKVVLSVSHLVRDRDIEMKPILLFTP